VNDLTDRYVYDVVRRLPEKSRPEVEKELRANIADMLPENPAEEDVQHALTSLGDPVKLAEQYRPGPQYLISPAVYDDYLALLKLLVPLLTAVIIVIKLADTLLNAPQDGTPVQVFAAVLSSVITGAVTAVGQAFLWTTLSFALLERFGIARRKGEWSVKDLPEVPPEAAVRIPRGEAVTSMVFSALGLLLVIRFPYFFAWWGLDGATASIPLFNAAVLSHYIPLFVLTTGFSWALALMKLFYRRWTYLLAACNAVSGAAGAIVTVLFLNDPETFNPAFLARLGQAVHLDAATVAAHWQTGITVLTVLVLLGALADIITNFVKAHKNRR
jgi:hypothetical protein